MKADFHICHINSHRCLISQVPSHKIKVLLVLTSSEVLHVNVCLLCVYWAMLSLTDLISHSSHGAEWMKLQNAFLPS